MSELIVRRDAADSTNAGEKHDDSHTMARNTADQIRRAPPRQRMDTVLRPSEQQEQAKQRGHADGDDE
jgi:hypothetical protein